MEALAALFESWSAGARSWLDMRPEGRVGQMPRIIAGKLGYPTARVDPFANGGLQDLSWAQAAHVLAVAGTVSLAYERWVPKRGALDDARKALKDMRHDAVFLSNGLWHEGATGWNPLSSATFDCGLIGFDSEKAFIFWVEEED